jgi:predicted carbohydrate-binding protein with CBM5 and CBM33 domain
MINILTFTSLALATLYMAVAPASAHGYVSQPPSRQARCRFNNVPGCGDVRWEPQSVEAIKGSLMCNGNGARFSELNNEALWQNQYFTVPQGADSISFTWTLTFSHRTSNWEYIMLTGSNEMLISFPDYSVPVSPVQHVVPLNGYTGRQKILARWNIGDTANAFYSCVDIFIPGSSPQTQVAGAAATQLPIGIPLPMPGSTALPMTTNGSGSADTGSSVNMALKNVFVIQGAQS